LKQVCSLIANLFLGLRKHKSLALLDKYNTVTADKKDKLLESQFQTLPHKDRVGEVPEFLPPMSRSGNRIVSKLPSTLKKMKEKVIKSEGGTVQLLSAFEGAYVSFLILLTIYHFYERAKTYRFYFRSTQIITKIYVRETLIM
jgi:hypothetical protein